MSKNLPSLIKFTYKDDDLKPRKLKRDIHKAPDSECFEYRVWEPRCRYWDLLTTEWYFFKKFEPTEADTKHIVSRINSAIEKLEMLPTTNHLYFFVHCRSTNNKSDWTFKTQQYLHRDAIPLDNVEKIL
uniref:Uncharacterized protein n=1 Tax=Panagrolaimus sp. PS1159 TaxID=55785 RepID=A0AC35F9V5_9BILA